MVNCGNDGNPWVVGPRKQTVRLAVYGAVRYEKYMETQRAAIIHEKQTNFGITNYIILIWCQKRRAVAAFGDGRHSRTRINACKLLMAVDGG